METGTLFDYTGLDPRKPNPPNVKPGPGTGPGTPTKPEAATNPKSTTEVCGQYCSGPMHLCSGDDGCSCIADPWQGTGSGFFTGSCKIPYIHYDSGRELQEVGLSTKSSGNATVSLTADSASLAGAACPCNCTYVSQACCTSDVGIVWEAPLMKLGSLQPPSQDLFCDKISGQFLPVP